VDREGWRKGEQLTSWEASNGVAYESNGIDDESRIVPDMPVGRGVQP
jgi:hypothetical protein